MLPVILAAVLAAAPAGAPRSAPPNVLLVTIDTLRADHVGAYGASFAATATIDRLAREGVRLADAVVHVPQTRPSHASLMTGRLPYEHGLRDNYSPPLPASLPTLASVLATAGWDTAGFVGAYPVSRPSGLDRGFALYDDPFAGGDASTSEARTERRAKEVVDRALAWLDRPRARPFFAWVHLFDPHAPYEAPAPFRARFAKRPYDGEVAYADAEVGRLVAWLDARGLRGRTLVVVTSDHGEGLGDHGEAEHMLFVYDSTLRVPLVASWPGRFPAGSVVTGQFRAIDLMATLLDLAGVAAPPTSGASRADALRTANGRIRDNESYAESLYAQMHFGYAPLRALRGEGWKLVDAPKAELYRVAEDPGETRNLLDARGAWRRPCGRASRRWTATRRRPRPSRRCRPTRPSGWPPSATSAERGRRPRGVRDRPEGPPRRVAGLPLRHARRCRPLPGRRLRRRRRGCSSRSPAGRARRSTSSTTTAARSSSCGASARPSRTCGRRRRWPRRATPSRASPRRPSTRGSSRRTRGRGS
ncbi:MAG: sulfatase [Vicinamibacteria bacterium]